MSSFCKIECHIELSIDSCPIFRLTEHCLHRCEIIQNKQYDQLRLIFVNTPIVSVIGCRFSKPLCNSHYEKFNRYSVYCRNYLCKR